MYSFLIMLAVFLLDCFDLKRVKAHGLSRFWHQPCFLIDLGGTYVSS